MIVCPAAAFEKDIYPKHSASPQSLRWLKQEAARRKIRIHHAACGHGGERFTEGPLWTDTTPARRLYFNTTAVTGTDALNVSRMIVMKSLPTMSKHVKTGTKQL